ncbi:hypothetical protein JTB14_022309 [Gonioctena quinquepunctata]|nr:hypothetical protein JTB14_022309 [Gonioctena quinquepunctata]
MGNFLGHMPRQRKRTTAWGSFLMKRAAPFGINGNLPLFRFVKDDDSTKEEEEFLKYIRLSAAIYFGLTPEEIFFFTGLSVLFSKWNLCTPTWSECRIVGKDWFTNFMRRNSIYSVFFHWQHDFVVSGNNTDSHYGRLQNVWGLAVQRGYFSRRRVYTIFCNI